VGDRATLLENDKKKVAKIGLDFLNKDNKLIDFCAGIHFLIEKGL
jgi:hypothetical protein